MNKYLNEILSNTDNNKVRSIKSIDSDDKKNILPLNEIEALILWNHYFSENVKYALLFERTYGAPIETPIFDESKIDSIELKETLRGIHRDETPILIYWNSPHCRQNYLGTIR